MLHVEWVLMETDLLMMREVCGIFRGGRTPSAAGITSCVSLAFAAATSLEL